MRFKKSHGFTLLETVVSLFLLAVMSVMAYQAIESVLDTNKRSQEDLKNEQKLQLAWQIISNDFLHLRARQYADGFGGIEAAYQTSNSDIILSFTRGGSALLESNPTGLTRIQYSLDDEGRLVRTVWPVFLSVRDSDGQQRMLLDGVSSVDFNNLTALGYYSLNWPPIDVEFEGNLLSLPLMVEVSIILEDGSISRRLLPGVGNNG
ncbi:MAG: type II secretion system minor pseudopilin GspJ [Pseudohongiellaceae bacterium]